MKPVMQTEIGRRGNCFAACLASLLEVELAIVPPLGEVSGDDIDAGPPNVFWWLRTREWLASRCGFDLLAIHPEREGRPLSRQGWTPTGYAILSCARPGPWTDADHAVVTLDGAIVHNPEVSIRPEPDPIVRGWFVLTPTRTTFEAHVAEAVAR
jgi:hypothetical protein